MRKFDYIISLQDACEVYGKKPSTLKTHITNGVFKEGIHVKKFGRTWVFDKMALDNYYNKKDDNYYKVKDMVMDYIDSLTKMDDLIELEEYIQERKGDVLRRTYLYKTDKGAM